MGENTHPAENPRESLGRIFLRDGKLMASVGAGEEPSVQLTPAGGDRFVVAGMPIVVEFVPPSAGRPQEVHVTGAGRPRVSQLVGAFSPSSAELQAFEGEYRSVEVEGTYTLDCRSGGLVRLLRSSLRGRPLIAPAL